MNKVDKKQLSTSLAQLASQYGIDLDTIIEVCEASILGAYKKNFQSNVEAVVKYNSQKAIFQLWVKREVVEGAANGGQITLERAKERFPEAKVGDIVDWELSTDNFTRVAINGISNNLNQKLAEFTKQRVLSEFSDRVGKIVNGRVKGFRRGDVIISLQNADAVMPAKEKIPDEKYVVDANINVLLAEINGEAKENQCLVVSRSRPRFVAELFRREVSEIREGTIKIVNIARDPGHRTKIAVRSEDPKIDPVGACIGPRGNRVRNITEELGNERIDIIQYSDDIAEYAAKAMAPAEVERVEVDEANHLLTIYVDQDQAKLAFGRKAQNVRLAANLLGWRVTIVQNEPDVPQLLSISEQIQTAADKLAGEFGVSGTTAVLLVQSGYATIDDVKNAEKEALLEIDGIDAAEVSEAFDNLMTK